MKGMKSGFFIKVSTIGKRLISASDYFAQQPQLRIQKQKKFSTLLGSFITCCIITACIFQFISQLKGVFQRSNPNVITSEFQLYNTDEYILSPNNYTLAIALMDKQLQAISGQHKYYNISLKNCKRQRDFNQTTGIATAQLDCYYYPLEECTERHFPQEFQSLYFKQLRKAGLYCARYDEWLERPMKFQGIAQAQIFQYIDITISICQNTTEYQNCSSQESIYKLLSGNYLVVYTSDVLTKMQESSKSFEDIIQAYYHFYSLSVTKTILSQIRLIETISDVGLLSQEIEKQITFQQSVVQETPETYNNQYFFKYGIIIDQRMTQYSRTYQKLQNAFSNIGGLWQVLCLIAQLFIYPFTSYLTEIEMANEYFRFEAESKGKNSISLEQKHKSFFIPQMQALDPVEEELPNTSDRVTKEKQKQFILQSRLENSIDVFKFLNYQLNKLKMSKEVILQLVVCCNKKKNQQISYAIDKVISKLDVLYIIQKLQEIDKLKYLLLSNDQLNLFNYIPKPLIPLGGFESEFKDNVKMLEKKIAYKLILDDEKSEVTKINDAFISYQNLKLKQNISKTDCQILEFLDDEIKYTFDQLLTQNFKALYSRGLSPRIDMESIYESRLPVRDSMNQV